MPKTLPKETRGATSAMSWLPPTLLILFTIVGLLGLYYVWNRYELSQAYNLMAEDEYESVIKHSNRLIWLGYKKQPARELRALAISEIDPEEGLVELQDLVTRKGADSNYEVSLRLVDLLMDSNDVEEARKYLDQLVDLDGTSPDYMLLRAKIQFSDGEYPESYETLRTLLKVAPNHAEGNFSYARFLLNSKDAVNEIPAKVSLRKAANTDSLYGLRALIMLATSPRIPLFPSDREWLANRLREHPQANSQTRILAATQELIFDGDQSEAIIERVINSEGSANPETIANWLLQIGQSDKALDFVTQGAGDALPVDLSAQVRLQALLMQNDFENVRKLLLEEESQFPKLLRETILAITDAVLTTSTSTSPTKQWLNAQELAREQASIEAVLTLAQVASRSDWLAEARESLEWALQESQNSVQTFRILKEMINVLYLQKDTVPLLKMARRLLQINPDDPFAQNNVYYLEALLNDPPDADPNRFLALTEKAPGGLYHSGYAFALWKVGEFERAAKQFDALDERLLAVPAARLIGALIAVEGDDLDKAHEIIADLAPEALLPEEARLLSELSDRLNK